MDSTRLEEFGRIDQTADPTYFIRFLDNACAEDSFRAYKARLLDLLGSGMCRRLLDVGCGTGDDAREMARREGSRGHVVGIDNSQAMIQEARRRCEGEKLSLEFQVADALQLPFPDQSFHGCRADRSLMHVPDAARALQEMARVTASGGHLVVYEVDFETLVIDADRDLARKVARTWCDSFRDGWLGRHIPALFRGLSLEDVVVIPHTLVLTPALARPILGATTAERAVAQGTLTRDEAAAWLAQFSELERSGRFFSTLGGYLVAGRK